MVNRSKKHRLTTTKNKTNTHKLNEVKRSDKYIPEPLQRTKTYLKFIKEMPNIRYLKKEGENVI